MVLDEKYVIGICTMGLRPTLDVFLEKISPVLAQHKDSVRILVCINGDGQMDFSSYPELQVVREPRLGIANARNRILQELAADENLIFIDDDEFPGDDWFANLVSSHKRYPQALIAGPVREVTPAGDVVTDSKIRPIVEVPDGAKRKTAATNNLLIPAAVINSGFFYFDLYFNFGGSDSDLTMRLGNHGYEIRWAADAVMYEVEDPDREDVEWAYRRDRRNAAIYSLVIKRNSRLGFMFSYFVKKVLQVGVYSVLQFAGKQYKHKYELYKIGLATLIAGRKST